MYDIETYFDDYNSHKNKLNLYLKSSTDFNPSVNIFPIKWTGFLGPDKIEIIQNRGDADFVFNDFPDKHNSLKPGICKIINDFLDDNM